MTTTKGTCPRSFVTQIFRNSKPSHGADRKNLKWMVCAIVYIFIVDIYWLTSVLSM
jgi:hypothetical protein